MKITEFEKTINQIMEDQHRKDPAFRLILTSSQVGDHQRYTTPCQTLNPPAREHGSKSEELLSLGLTVVMLGTLYNSLGIPIEQSIEYTLLEESNQQGIRMPRQLKTIATTGSKLFDAKNYEEDIIRINLNVNSQLGNISRLIATHSNEEKPNEQYLRRVQAITRTQDQDYLLKTAMGNLLLSFGAISKLREVDFEEGTELALEHCLDKDWQTREGHKDYITGIPITMGATNAKAYVVDENHPIEDFKSGILVVKHFRTEYIEQLGKASGVIADQGSRCCHLATIVRGDPIYSKIPILVGTGNATEKLQHGKYTTMSLIDPPIVQQE